MAARDERGRTLESRVRYEGRTIAVRSERVALPNGHEVELEVVHHPGAAAVVPLDTDGSLLMVRQYRHTVGGWLLEVPAGKLSPGEDPAACAHRELEEEAGVRASTLRELGSIFVSPGFCDERIWLFLATNLTASEQSLEADEVLAVERVPRRGFAVSTHPRSREPPGRCLVCTPRAPSRWCRRPAAACRGGSP